MTITAKVIADSVGPCNPRLTTLQLRYPKFIHGEFMTHRVFSRNASSSRAIPVERLIKDVIEDPVYPSFWGKNQPGMQAKEEHNGLIDLEVEEFYESKPEEPDSGFRPATRMQAWDWARGQAIDAAKAFSKAGYHKQIINRLLEPFCHINVVVTATEWSNFFALRCHPDAQPEMRLLAEKIRFEMAASKPINLEPGQWHLPYVDFHVGNVSEQDELKILTKVSVARCARVSYLTQDGKQPNMEEDLKLYDRLIDSIPLHASPAEHQATPDEENYSQGAGGGDNEWRRPHLHGNLCGWIQYRKTLLGENQ